jgi:hypothetical protein
LGEHEIVALNKLERLEGSEQITGLTIDREDRPRGEYRFYGSDDIGMFYTNGWGDMTIVLSLEREPVVTMYTFSIYMEGGDETYLRKHTTEALESTSMVSKQAGHLLALIEDPLDKETGLNEIDQFEYQALLKLVRNVRSVTTLT